MPGWPCGGTLKIAPPTCSAVAMSILWPKRSSRRSPRGRKIQTEMNALFARNKTAQELAQVLGELQEAGRVTLTKETTGTRGAPRKVWSLVP